MTVRWPVAAAGSGPLVFAHRGASAEAPEHTRAAFGLAVEQGADGLEADVRRTADGVLVCVHDRTLRRTTGGAGAGIVISTTGLAEIERYDVGSWHSEGYRGQRVPTVRALLTLARGAGRPLWVALETKHPTRHGGRVERDLAQLLTEEGLTSPDPLGVSVALMSFDGRAVSRFAALLPDLPCVLLRDRPPLDRLPWAGIGADCEGWGVAAIRARPGVVAQARARGRGVAVWTVDDPADVALCRDLQVDTIITNRPAAVRAQLGPRGRGRRNEDDDPVALR